MKTFSSFDDAVQSILTAVNNGKYTYTVRPLHGDDIDIMTVGDGVGFDFGTITFNHDTGKYTTSMTPVGG